MNEVHEAGSVIITGAFGNMGKTIAADLSPQRPLGLFTHGAARPHGLPTSARVSVVEHVNLLEAESVTASVARVQRELGPISGLVHTVGGYAGGASVRDQTFASARDLIETNYLSALPIVQAVLPDMIARGAGRIVLFASADALHARAGASAYAASKAALLRFAEALSAEVAEQGVGVCVLLPTTIDTPSNRAAMPTANFSNWVTPAEVARVVSFLLSPASSGIRFATLPLGT